jgi:hypothetical protein
LTNEMSEVTLRNADRGMARIAAVALKALLVGFIFVCIFDPADKVIGGKVWLFVGLWGVTLYGGVRLRRETSVPLGLIVYVAVFVVIPSLAIAYYYLMSGLAPYEGFTLLKGYLLISLAVVLVANRVDCIPMLSMALMVLACLTIAIFAFLQTDPDMFMLIHDLGEKYGVISLSERSYGGGIVINQITFATAPMLAIAIPHFFDRAARAVSRSKRRLYFGCVAICAAGMFLAGLRNTMAAAVLLPFLLWPLYTRRVVRNVLLSFAILAMLALPFASRLRTLLDPSELSNGIKLKFVADYFTILSDPVTLLFGQGLGAYYRWSSSGLPNFESTGANFYFITELTYLEMVRSFGLVGAAVMLLLLLYPVWRAFIVGSDRRRQALAVGYLTYLGMCAANPLLFSSLGILILAAILADTFLAEDRSGRTALRSQS